MTLCFCQKFWEIFEKNLRGTKEMVEIFLKNIKKSSCSPYNLCRPQRAKIFGESVCHMRFWFLPRSSTPLFTCEMCAHRKEEKIKLIFQKFRTPVSQTSKSGTATKITAILTTKCIVDSVRTAPFLSPQATLPPSITKTNPDFMTAMKRILSTNLVYINLFI